MTDKLYRYHCKNGASHDYMCCVTCMNQYRRNDETGLDLYERIQREEQEHTIRAAERTRTIEEVLELLVDRELVDYPNGMPKDALLYGRDEGYNQCITELRAKLEAMKGSE